MSHYFTNDENLKSEFRKLEYKYQDFSFCFISDNGIFSKDKIDYGSRLLLETFIKNNKLVSNVLDLGCGYGFIGIVINKIYDCKVDMCDINSRAVHLTKMNIKNNKADCNVFESNTYENVVNKYDFILCNPPIRAGKSVVMNMLGNAKNYLNKNGELWFVMKKDHGLKSTLKTLEKQYHLEVIIKSKTFYIIKAKIVDL